MSIHVHHLGAYARIPLLCVCCVCVVLCVLAGVGCVFSLGARDVHIPQRARGGEEVDWLR